MQVVRGFRTELRPTRAQERLFNKACGVARFAYNWGLERNNNVWLYNQLPHRPIGYESPRDQHRVLNSVKREEFPWMYEVSKCAPQEALRDLGDAFHNFLIRRDHFGWPRFKSKRDGRQSFTLTGSIRVKDRSIQLPRLGRVKLKERGYLPAGGTSSPRQSRRKLDAGSCLWRSGGGSGSRRTMDLSSGWTGGSLTWRRSPTGRSSMGAGR